MEKSYVTESEKRMYRNWRRMGRAISISASCFVFFGAFFIADYLVNDRRPPISLFGAVTAIDPVVYQGTKIRVRVYRNKVRDCPLVAEPDPVDIHGARYIGFVPGKIRDKGGRVGSAFVDVVYDVSLLPPGQYSMPVRLRYYCEEGVHEIMQPAFTFRIKRRPINAKSLPNEASD